MQTLLITGIGGFIGYSFSNYLFKNLKKIKIIGIDNLNNYYSPRLKIKRVNILKKNNNFIFKKIDLTNENQVNSLFVKYKFDTVIHFAAQAGVRYSVSYPDKYIKSNTLGFFNILNSCKKNKIKKLLYSSSSSVYGGNTKYPSKENFDLKPNNIYSLTKKNNEELAQLYSNYYNLNIIGLRFFTVFGEWGRPDMMIMKYMKSVVNKKIKFYLYNKGNHVRDLTYIDDINNILFKLLKKDLKKHNIFNICSNKPVKITKILKLINFNMKNSPKVFKIGKQKADLLKTHGSNLKINKLLKIRKYTPIEKAMSKLSKWCLSEEFKKYY